MAKEDGAAVHRIRWYGKRDPTSPIQRLFIERKTHRNDWTGAVNIKDRAAILQCNVSPFLNGKRPEVPEMLRRDASADMLHEVQDLIIEKQQKPIMRSVYNRTAFQASGDCSTRVTFDRNIAMVRESRKWGVEKDVYDTNDVVKFNYCVMEIKLQKEAPEWLQKLVQDEAVVSAPGFSKFLHGVSLLYHDQVDEQPYWIQIHQGRTYVLNLDQMNRRSSPLSDVSNLPELNLHKVPEDLKQTHEPNEQSVVDIISSGSKEGKESSDIQPISQGSSAMLVMSQQQSTPYPARGYSKASSSFSPPSIQPPQNVQQNEQKRKERVVIRTRVEPKVFFANERTFLSWLAVAILLVFTALSLINQHMMVTSDKGQGGVLRRCQQAGHSEIQCKAGLISGAAMAPVGIILIVYALFMYRKRSFQILRRDTQRYDDQLGPLVLSLVLISVMMLSYILTLVAAL
eukprot:TRINITY_DN5710_c0_g1_i6.p1 TRINITY_DN5710_c0_g1~~TRINITY_DN5710_c0_g1_i6.p1  ORF type:complete len:510 (-),score=71.74 TRINITY_DN5710_c0_g1_i6:912-2279(-)